MEKMYVIAGMPRSGSMWTYNVLRDVFAVAAYDVLPRYVPENNKEKTRIFREEAMQDHVPEHVYVLKTHLYLNLDMPRAYFFTTIRDVRDALMSWMRFMNADFELALQAAEGMTRNCDHYLACPEGKHTRLRYTDMLNKPADVLAFMCQHIGLAIKAEDIKTIVDRHSKKNVARRIAAKESSYKASLEEGQQMADMTTVESYNGAVRLYDKLTGFQSGHVSSYKDGDWQTLLSAQQIDLMHQRLGSWLERNGFLLSP